MAGTNLRGPGEQNSTLCDPGASVPRARRHAVASAMPRGCELANGRIMWVLFGVPRQSKCSDSFDSLWGGGWWGARVDRQVRLRHLKPPPQIPVVMCNARTCRAYRAGGIRRAGASRSLLGCRQACRLKPADRRPVAFACGLRVRRSRLMIPARRRPSVAVGCPSPAVVERSDGLSLSGDGWSGSRLG